MMIPPSIVALCGTESFRLSVRCLHNRTPTLRTVWAGFASSLPFAERSHSVDRQP
ncbi:hypothetical protein [Ruminococcus callidus]|uniref:hypothetical protein n=1 Tax=Ruminococcus callidus TaxID=40519 RepID=UPI003521C334